MHFVTLKCRYTLLECCMLLNKTTSCLCGLAKKKACCEIEGMPLVALHDERQINRIRFQLTEKLKSAKARCRHTARTLLRTLTPGV